MPQGPPGSSGPTGFPPGSFLERWFDQDRDTHEIAARTANVTLTGLRVATQMGQIEAVQAQPLDLMLQAAVTLGEKVSEGHIIEAVSIPWLAFLGYIKRNPDSIHEIDWRKWEEIIAGGYSDAGYSVILTPRSGDRGRDIIATKHGLLSVRYFDQVKAYRPGNLVTLDDVHAMVGVLSVEGNVSKGIITTTSDFAPGVYTDERIKDLLPYRLDLRPRDELLKWLEQIARGKRDK